jgi:riboflavin synthase alpha subunit
MPPEFCKEHSEVMRCLGALETGQTNMSAQNQRIEEKIDKGHMDVLAKIDEMKQSEQKKTLADAIQGTKISLLFWVLAIGFVALISGAANTVFKALGWK